MATWNRDLEFYLNGKRVREAMVDPEMTLMQYLRDPRRNLTSVKAGCREGACGTCTVTIAKWDPTLKKAVYQALNACLRPLASIDGCHVITSEGIGSIKKGLHPIQERLYKAHGSQCGFCSPGMVMSMYALLRNKTEPSVRDIEESFDGNICRCTGYRPIFRAFKSFAVGCGRPDCCQEKEEEEEECCGGGEEGCSCKDKGCGEAFGSKGGVMEGKDLSEEFGGKHDPSMDLIFPPPLKREKSLNRPLRLQGPRLLYFHPTSLAELKKAFEEAPNAVIVAGNTDLGLSIRLKGRERPAELIDISCVEELTTVDHLDAGMRLGASVSLSTMQMHLQKGVDGAKHPDQAGVYSALLGQLHRFAGTQIRNASTLGGHVALGSATSDLNPMLMACAATIECFSPKKNVLRKVPAREFFKPEGGTVLEKEEIVQAVFLPAPGPNDHARCFKLDRRRDADVAGGLVTSAFFIQMDKDMVVRHAGIACGGVGPGIMPGKRTEAYLQGKTWDDDLLKGSMALLKEDFPIEDDGAIELKEGICEAELVAGGGSVRFRRTLIPSFWFKFFYHVLRHIHGEEGIPARVLSAIHPMEHGRTSGKQSFAVHAENAPVGVPVPHMSGQRQVTGEAEFAADVVLPQGSLHAAPVCSKRAAAKILKVDYSAALEMPGVVAKLDHTDVPGSNMIGAIHHDEELFASEEVVHWGQMIALIVAETREQALEAAQAVKVEYEDKKLILTIKDAIEADSFFEESHWVGRGDMEEGFKKSAHIIEGIVRSGGQEHMYLEPQVSYAIPGEVEEEVMIHSATQNTAITQQLAASVLGVDNNKIVARVKRCGGAFGGKETRNVVESCAVALAASKFRRAVVFEMDRHVDVTTSGHRHPMEAHYKVGYNDDGRVVALEMNYYFNSGHSYDLSAPVMDSAVLNADNSYNIPYVRAIGRLCKTNTASNTALRGFGNPQAIMACENWIERIAHSVGKPPEVVREMNFYKPGDKTHFGRDITSFNTKLCWDQIMRTSDFERRKAAVQKFNKDHRWRKRGICVMPSTYGIGFHETFMNQAGALVHVHRDGSVLITHGGVEMGQGLNTKLCQVAAVAMGVPLEKCFIAENSSDKVANAIPTSASLSVDLYAPAIVHACESIKRKLEEIRMGMDNPEEASFTDVVNAAYFSRVDLSSHGFNMMSGAGYNFHTHEGVAFRYFSCGVAVSEVEIDCLTGDSRLIRCDIVMDLGDSLNPALDIGQIEGAYVQGMGWSTREQLQWSRNGRLLTCTPATYQVPGPKDIPEDFRVGLLKEAPCPVGVHSSKGVGEPPLLFGASSFFAIRNAIMAARKDAATERGEVEDEWVQLDAPLTAERIRLACNDAIVQDIPEDGEPVWVEY